MGRGGRTPTEETCQYPVESLDRSSPTPPWFGDVVSPDAGYSSLSVQGNQQEHKITDHDNT